MIRDALPPARACAPLAAWSVVEAVPAMLSGLLLSWTTAAVLAGRTVEAAVWLAALVGAVTIGTGATWALFPRLAQVVERVRERLTARVTEAAVARLAASGRSTAAPVAQVTDHIDQIRGLLASLLRSLRSTVFPVLAALAGLALLDPRLAVVVAVPLVAALGVTAALGRPLVRRFRDAAVAEEELGRRAAAVLVDADTVQGLGATGWATDELLGAISSSAGADRRAANVQAVRHAAVFLAAQGPLLALLVAGPPLLSRGAISPAALLGAAAYVLTVLGPAVGSTITGAGGWLLELSVLSSRLAFWADAPEPAPPRSRDAEIPAHAAIVTAALCFSYSPAARPVLTDLDLCIPRGALVAITGPSGCGKSTLARLVAGLEEPTTGSVGVRGHLLLVPQETHLLDGTVGENISYGLPVPPTTTALKEAIAAVGLRLDPARRVDPLELASGDRQRLALARAVLAEADILVLDETLAAFADGERFALERVLRSRGRTVLVVAHDLGVVARADLVVHFSPTGVSVGTHEELLSADWHYRELVEFADASDLLGASQGPLLESA